MNTITTPKDNTNLPLLMYTGLFGLDVNITSTDAHWIIEYPKEIGEAVCEAVEAHNGYAMQFPEVVQQEMISNARVYLTNELNKYLDSVAQSLRYDDMKSVRSYAGFDNYYQNEAIELAKWSADCWVKAGEIEADVVNGVRDIPTIGEVINELPPQPIIEK